MNINPYCEQNILLITTSVTAFIYIESLTRSSYFLELVLLKLDVTSYRQYSSLEVIFVRMIDATVTLIKSGLSHLMN